MPAQRRCWPGTSLHLCPQVEETAAFIGHNQSKVTGKIAVARSASSVLQAVLGLFSSSRPSLAASEAFRGRSPKWRSAAYCTGLIFSHNKFNLTESSFLKVRILSPFS